jgi:hypothetical protein
MDPRAWLARWWDDATPLAPPSDAAFTAFSVGLGLFALLLANLEFVPVLDHANLAFHEAGHMLFGVFGATASLYGGTLMQFVFPTVTALRFLHRGQALAAAVCALWFCENLRYTSFYVADAQLRALPLVGGGEHDWFHILSRWDALKADATVAAWFAFFCWAGMAAVWLALWRLRRPAPPPRRRARNL